MKVMMRNLIMRKAVAFISAVVVTYLTAVLLVSQFNMARISELGHAISLPDRLQTIWSDWLGMLSTYLPLIVVAFLIAFVFTAFILQRFVARSAVLYLLAGFVAILALHLIANSVFGIVAIAPTRTVIGLVAQGTAGALGACLFYRLAWPTT